MRSFTAGLMAAAELTNVRSGCRSCGRASRAAAIGRANASPTSGIRVARSRSAVAIRSAASRPSTRSGNTTQAPAHQPPSADQVPAPCMSGGPTSTRASLRTARSTASPRSVSGLPSRRRRPSGPSIRSPMRHSTPFGIPVVPPV